MGEFIDRLLQHHASWSDLPVVERTGDGWRGVALIVPSPDGSDLAGPLVIEETGREVTINLDHSHVHIDWPTRKWAAGNLWLDVMAVIDAILSEKILAVSGWADGRLRVGSLQEVATPTELVFPNLQRLRFRSWQGTLDRDEVLDGGSDLVHKS